jgi:hypothetical protein
VQSAIGAGLAISRFLYVVFLIGCCLVLFVYAGLWAFLGVLARTRILGSMGKEK